MVFFSKIIVIFMIFEEHHFEIEDKAFPKKPQDETDESENHRVGGKKVCSNLNEMLKSV